MGEGVAVVLIGLVLFAAGALVVAKRSWMGDKGNKSHKEFFGDRTPDAKWFTRWNAIFGSVLMALGAIQVVVGFL